MDGGVLYNSPQRIGPIMAMRSIIGGNVQRTTYLQERGSSPIAVSPLLGFLPGFLLLQTRLLDHKLDEVI